MSVARERTKSQEEIIHARHERRLTKEQRQHQEAKRLAEIRRKGLAERKAEATIDATKRTVPTVDLGALFGTATKMLKAQKPKKTGNVMERIMPTLPPVATAVSAKEAAKHPEVAGALEQFKQKQVERGEAIISGFSPVAPSPSISGALIESGMTRSTKPIEEYFSKGPEYAVLNISSEVLATILFGGETLGWAWGKVPARVKKPLESIYFKAVKKLPKKLQGIFIDEKEIITTRRVRVPKVIKREVYGRPYWKKSFQMFYSEPTKYEREIARRVLGWVSSKKLNIPKPSGGYTPLSKTFRSGALMLVQEEKVAQQIVKELPTLTIRTVSERVIPKKVVPAIIMVEKTVPHITTKTTVSNITKNLIKTIIGVAPKFASSSKPSAKPKSKSRAKDIEKITPKPPKPKDVEVATPKTDVAPFEGVEEFIEDIAKQTPIIKHKPIVVQQPKYVQAPKQKRVSRTYKPINIYRDFSPPKPLLPPKASSFKLPKPKKRKRKATPATLYGWVGLEVPVPSAKQILKEIIGGKK